MYWPFSWPLFLVKRAGGQRDENLAKGRREIWRENQYFYLFWGKGDGNFFENRRAQTKRPKSALSSTLNYKYFINAKYLCIDIFKFLQRFLSFSIVLRLSELQKRDFM